MDLFFYNSELLYGCHMYVEKTFVTPRHVRRIKSNNNTMSTRLIQLIYQFHFCAVSLLSDYTD